MKFNFKRLMAMLLSVMMVVSMLPTAVFAADADETPTSGTDVAKIGEKSYGSLAEAISEAAENATILLYADVDSIPTINKAITIKGGAEGVEVNCAIAENFPNIEGTVTFENLTFNDRISTENASSDQSKMTLKFVGCTFNVPAGNTYAIQGGASGNNDVLGALVVEDCTFETAASSYTKGYMVYAQCVKTVTVTGSTFDGSSVYRGAIHLGDSTEYATTATVSGNTIKNTARGVQVGNRVEGSTLTISGNTFENVNAINGETESAVVYIHEVASAETTSVAVSSNTVTGASESTPVIFSENATGAISDFVTEFTGNTVNSATVSADSNGVYSDTVYVETPAVTYAVYVNGTGYETLDKAIEAANALTGDVTVEIYDAVEFTQSAALKGGSYNSISFVGKDTDAKITINIPAEQTWCQYLESNTTASFTDLILDKANLGYQGNSAHMGNYFSIHNNGTGSTTYTRCTFPNGASTMMGTATYTNCTFSHTQGEYSMWIYNDSIINVNTCTVNGPKGVKLYCEGGANSGNDPQHVVIKNTTFTENLTAKAAVALTYGEKLELIGNIYNNPTPHIELNTTSDSNNNGTVIVAQDAQGNDIGGTLTCVANGDPGTAAKNGVLVTDSDGTTKIYTSVTAASADAPSGSTVTLLHNTTETVELAEGVTLNTNNYTAENVSVATPASATIGSSLINMDDSEEVFIYAEISGLDKAPATQSVVIKTYSGETLVATTTLAKSEYYAYATLGVKICLTGDSSSWDTVWETGMPRADVVPDKNVLYVDGTEVSEATVPMTKTGDERAVNWAEVPGVNPAPVAGPVEVATYADLVAALANGGEIKLTANIDFTTSFTTNKDATIDLNGKTLNIKVGEVNFSGCNVTIKNGTIDVSGVVATADAIFNIGKTEAATLTLDAVDVTGNTYSSAFGVFYIRANSTLNVNGGVWNLKNDTFAEGGVFKANDATAALNITGAQMTLHNVRRVVTHAATTIANSTMTITGDANGVDAEMEHGFNRSSLSITNSTITMENLVGRGITAENGAVSISRNSTVTITNAQEATIDVRKGQTVTVDNTSTVTVDAEPTITSGTVSGVTVRVPPAGDIQVAYVSADYNSSGVGAFYGEAVGVVGTESFVVKLYSDETLVGTAALVDTDKVLLNGKSNTVTWHAALANDSDSWWNTTWNQTLNVDNIPNKVELWVDGVLVDTGVVELNMDNLKNPICAAVTDVNGNIQSFVAGTGHLNSTLEYDTALQAAVAAGGNIVLLRDVDLTKLIKVSGKTVTLNGNGHSITGTGALWLESGTYNVKNIVFDRITYNTNYGVLEFVNATATVSGCTFRDNTAVNCIAVDCNAANGTSNVTIDDCTFTGNNCSSTVINSADGTTTVKNSAITNNTADIAVIYNSADITVTGNSFSGNTLAGTNANKAVILTGPYVEGEYSISITENAFLDTGVAVYVENWSEEYSAVSTNELSGNYWLDGDEPVAGTDYVAEDGSAVTLDNYYTAYSTDANGNVVLAEADKVTIGITGLSGEGTEAEPYLINNLEELKWFRDDVNAGNTYAGKYVKLTANIDLAGEEWTPIGYMGKTFTGTFDGGNNTIKNLVITKTFTNSDENNGIGLFGRTDDTAVIQNLTIENVDITGSLYVGAVVGLGYTGNKIENVTVKGNIAIDAWWYAGVIGGYGYMNLVNECHVIGNDGSYIKGNDGSYIGGIWGFRGEGDMKITECSVTNLSITGVDRVGGIAGIGHYGNEISDCSADKVTVTATDPEATTVGLIVGATQGKDSDPTTFTNNDVEDVTAQIANGDGTYTEVTNLYGTNIDGSTPVTNYVAQVGTTVYESLAEAFAAVDAAGKAGETITLLKDVTLTEGVSIMNSTVLGGVTLDGNGKTITLDMNGEGTGIRFGGEWATGVKIHDLTITGSAQYALWLNGGTSSELTNVKITGTYDAVYGALVLYGTHGATMTNCDIVSGFTNGQGKFPLYLVNSKIGNLAANEGAVGSGAKVFVDANSSIEKVVCGSDNSSMIDPDSVARITTILLATGETWADTVAPSVEVNGVYYDALAKAIEAAEANDTITLLDDVADAGTITLKAGVTLDGKGKTISGNSSVHVNAAGGTIQNVTFKNISNGNNLSAVYASNLSGKLTITGCTFSGADWDSIQATPVAGAEIVITGNTFETGGIEAQRYIHIQSAKNVDFSATVTGNKMYEGTKNGPLGCYYFTDAAKIDVSGNYIAEAGNVCILMNDGENVYEEVLPLMDETLENEIKYAALIKSTYFATGYADLATAITAAQAGDTVTLLEDVTLTDVVTIDKGITIDGADKTITFNAKDADENVFNITAASDSAVVIKNLNIVGGTQLPKRGVVVNNAGVDLTLEKVSITGINYYPIVLGQSSGDNILTIKNSTISGWCALNIWGTTGSTINVTDSYLIGTSKNNNDSSYGVIVLNTNDHKVTVTGGSITTNDNSEKNIQSIVFLQDSTEGTTADAENCTVVLDTELVLNGETATILNVLDTNSIAVRAEYADELAAEGYDVSDAVSGMVTVQEKAEEVETPITFANAGHNLRLQDLIKIGFYFTATPAEGKTATEVGAYIWAAGTDEASASKVVATYDSETGRYAVESDGIRAQELDVVYYAKYYAVINGVEYSDIVDDYAATEYLQYVYANYTSGDLLSTRSLVIDLANYAAMAQTYFALSNDAEVPETLINSFMADDDKTLNWSDNLKRSNPTVSKSTSGGYAATWGGANVNLIEALSLSFIVNNTDVEGVIYWTQADYDANSTLSYENKSGEGTLRPGDGRTFGTIPGLYSFNIYDNYYAAMYKKDGDNYLYSEVYGRSIASYATFWIEYYASATNAEDVALRELCKAMLIYGNNAETYFD